MRVEVDGDVCGGHGDCVLAAPGVFDFEGDDDVVSVLQPEPPEKLWDACRDARDVCPTQAITVTE